MDIGPEFDVGPMEMNPGGFDMPGDGFVPDELAPEIDPGPADFDPGSYELTDTGWYEPVEPFESPEPDAPLELIGPYEPGLSVDSTDPMEPIEPYVAYDPADPYLPAEPDATSPAQFNLEPEPLIVDDPSLNLPEDTLERQPTETLPGIAPESVDLLQEDSPAEITLVDPSLLPSDFNRQNEMTPLEPIPEVDNSMPAELQPTDTVAPTGNSPLPGENDFSELPEPTNPELVPGSDGYADNAAPLYFDPVPSESYSDIPIPGMADSPGFEQNMIPPSDDLEHLDIVPPLSPDPSIDFMSPTVDYPQLVPQNDIPVFDEAPDPSIFPELNLAPKEEPWQPNTGPESEYSKNPESLPEQGPGEGHKPSWPEAPDDTTPVNAPVPLGPADELPEREPVDHTPEERGPVDQVLEEATPAEVLPPEMPEAPELVPSSDAVLPPLDDPSTVAVREIGKPNELADFWRNQESDSDCAIFAQGGILDAFGQEFDREKYVQQGIDGQYYTPDGDDAGTTQDGLGQVLVDNGIEVTRYDSGATFQDMVSELEQGHGVVAGVNVFPLEGWEHREDGHALWVTGMEVGPDGVPTSIICNDSGRSDGSGVAYPFWQFKEAWDMFGNQMVATKDSFPGMH